MVANRTVVRRPGEQNPAMSQPRPMSQPIRTQLGGADEDAEHSLEHLGVDLVAGDDR